MSKFLCDRMLKKLAIWLRIAGYDTLYIADLEFEGDEDTYMVCNHLDRILLTRDKELYARSKAHGRPVILIKSDDVAEQIAELMEKGFDFELKMDRCSVCNTPLRKPTDEEALEVMRREGIREDLRKRYELWYCERCRKLYWMGSHWRNMVEFLGRVRSISPEVTGKGMEKLKHLLKHWIEHSEEHNAKYSEWADRIRGERPDVAELIDKAVEKFREGEEYLKKALERL